MLVLDIWWGLQKQQKKTKFMKTVNPEKEHKVNWKSVILFYFLACLFSWPFFWWRDIESESWIAWNVPAFIKTGSYMWGPGVAALICFFTFKKSHKRTITFFGSSFIKSLILVHSRNGPFSIFP